MNKSFEEKTIRLFGDSGKEWLEKIPEIIKELTEKWNLSEIVEMEKMQHGYVAKAMREGIPVVLKMTFWIKSIENQIKALQIFEDYGAVKLFSYSSKHNAILLERAIPGKTLRTIYHDDMDECINIYSSLANRLHLAPLQGDFSVLEKKLEKIDEADLEIFKKRTIDKAIRIKRELFDDMKQRYMLHGDFHDNNIIQHKDKWIIIDPEEVMSGDREYDLAKFNFVNKKEAKQRGIFDTVKKRVDLLVNQTNINKEKLQNWIFIRKIYGEITHVNSIEKAKKREEEKKKGN